MQRPGALATGAGAAPQHLTPGRRLAWGVLASLVFHALLLSLQFGVPGMAMQGPRAAINMTLAEVLPPVTPPPLEPAAVDPVPPATPAPMPAPVTGMRLLDPVAKPLPAPPPKVVKKVGPRKAPRVSAPLPKPETDTPVRVIAQASDVDSDFVVPLPQPEEALQKTIDPVEAQHGTDDVAEVGEDAAPLPSLDLPALASTDALDARLAQLADEQRQAAAAEREQALIAQQEQEHALEREQRLAQELVERQQTEQLLAQQMERQKSEALLAEQLRLQQLREAQRSEELLAQQRRDTEQAERARADALLAQQRLAQQQAERQRLDELAARKLAQERASQLAAQARDHAVATTPAPPGDPFGAADGQGGSGRAKTPAGNYGSDLANRVRELGKGIDLLTGAPPAQPRQLDERQQRRVLADSADRDVPLRMYVDSWRQKIERNGAMNFPQLIDERARSDPLVSVAVRSDGSIEDVTIVRSSGRQDTDEAVRRIVRINALYSKFPPNIAARYDVIEIRRIWRFDQVLKLIEEVR